jgi:hypothetical protein
MSLFFKSLKKALSKTAIKPILVGGWALNQLGHTRNTMDLDLMVVDDDVEKLHHHLTEAGFKMVFHNPELFAKYKFMNDKMLELDILFVDKTTYAKLKSGATETNIGDIDCVLPSPMSLIAMKLHSMKNNFDNRFPKDFPDIVALIDIYGIDVSSSSFKGHCLKYGDMRVFELLLKTKMEK